MATSLDKDGLICHIFSRARSCLIQSVSRIWTSKFAYGGLILGSSQFTLKTMLAQFKSRLENNHPPSLI